MLTRILHEAFYCELRKHGIFGWIFEGGLSGGLHGEQAVEDCSEHDGHIEQDGKILDVI